MTYSPVYEKGRVAPWVTALKDKSGCYIIKKRGILGAVLYVGESHTGRLKKTLLRHFQKWKAATAGPTFKAAEVEVATVRTPPAQALELQNALIEDLQPEINKAWFAAPGVWVTKGA